MNKVIQVATLGKDPEVKSYGEGKSLVKFSGAVPRRFHKEGEADTDWFQYTAFGKTADFISKYFKKGSKILITGTIQNNNYTKDDGTKVYSTQIVVDDVEFYGKKSDGEVSNSSGNAESNASQTASKPNSAPAAESYDAYDDF